MLVSSNIYSTVYENYQGWSNYEHTKSAIVRREFSFLTFRKSKELFFQTFQDVKSVVFFKQKQRNGGGSMLLHILGIFVMNYGFAHFKMG